MPAPGSNYRGTHADINGLMLFPWPDAMRWDITAGQVGCIEDMTWRQYLAVIGEFWERTYRYPRHAVRIDNSRVTVREQSQNAQVFGLCVRALVERGYLNPQTGVLTPPVPFAPPPPEYRDPPPGWGS